MHEPMSELEGKVALITGVSSLGGIGFAVTKHLASLGAQVIISGRDIASLTKAQERILELGSDCASYPADLCSESEIINLIDQIKHCFSRLDILVNNAATLDDPADTTVTDTPLETWDAIFEVNARGTMLILKHALPLMIAGGGGSIVNLSSISSLVGGQMGVGYACSKGAINTLTKYVAAQYGNNDVRCNAIAGGATLTHRTQMGMSEEQLACYREFSALGQAGSPNDIANLVGFLASPKSSWLTGQIITMDGGYLSSDSISAYLSNHHKD